ncbi:MAG: Peptidoglycan D,D-transpeptidase MrdA [uncultured Frankineae bacterium]|uniref:Peptidoglycan D,D-transpeptidase MrdA n=1 Tax=uncultured Frankineae bacterium TaxID=437475 RepID=A0A6J4MMN6_9ACTN|nr:MAG: Peptidoglycan D,D-transpeptidase MrdA [uncultured Frankineae bacterium]
MNTRWVPVTDRSRPRLFVLRVFVLTLLVTLFGRLVALQVTGGQDYAQAASANRVRPVVEAAPRGEVLDVRGAPLVRNRSALVVSVSRSTLLRQPDDGRAVLDRLAAVIGTPADELARSITPCGGEVVAPCWRGSPYQPVPVAEYDASDAAGLRRVLRIEERREEFPGVRAEFAAVRDYPRGTLAAHLLGYLGPISPAETKEPAYEGVSSTALVGRAGVEATYESALRGRDGVTELLVDRLGGVAGTSGSTPPVPGDTLVLSLDAGVQAVAEKALQGAIDRARTLRARGSGKRLEADSGSVVVLEAKTGRVVAMASYPSYDPSVFVGGASPAEYAELVDEDKGAPLVFRAIQGAYAPASTFKVVSTVGAVESGDYPLHGRFPCPGVYGPTGQSNFDSAPLGTVDLRQALVKSCDTVFYKFAYEQWQRDGGNRPVDDPKDPMVRMAQAFGLGQRTGVDLPSERRGTIADRAYKQALWEQTRDNRCKGAVNPELSPERRRANEEYCEDGHRFRGGDATNFAIGQGDTLVTPLQLATVYAAIANGGRLLEPHVARALVSPSGAVREIEPVVRSTVPASAEVLGYVREALAGVTQPGGTAAGAFAGSPVAVAGKTGTGEVAGKQDTSWFASFAPADAPELVVVGMVSQGGTGGTVAAPMVREVYDGIYGPGGLPGGRLPTTVPTGRPGASAAAP